MKIERTFVVVLGLGLLTGACAKTSTHVARHTSSRAKPAATPPALTATNATAAAAATNQLSGSVVGDQETSRFDRIEAAMQSTSRIKGSVRDPSGAPATNLTLIVHPNWGRSIDREIRTDSNGRFEAGWNLTAGSSGTIFCLIAQDPARNLAAARDIVDELANLDLTLAPGLTLCGRVEDSAGKAITNAAIQVQLWAGNSIGTFRMYPEGVDAQGRYKINALPATRRYSLWIQAKRYGSESRHMQAPELETNQVEFETAVLNLADRPLAGRLIDVDEKPITNAWVHIYGPGQPSESVRSDTNGGFTFSAVCEGPIRIQASAQRAYANTQAEGGDTNVILKMGVNDNVMGPRSRREMLTGKPLPNLAALDIAGDLVPENKPVLLCLFDVEQRPSRRFVRLIDEQFEQLQEKGITVIGIQAAITADESFNAWKNSSPLPFPIGRLVAKHDTTKWLSELDVLPWLILANAEHRVVAEGFPLDGPNGLEAKLTAMGCD